jgi:nitrite reductase/ring-hydroxylating ferredoxin subunit
MNSPLDRRDLLRRGLFAAGFAPLCCVTPEAPAGSFSFDGRRLLLDRALLRKPGAAIAVVDAARNLNLIVIHATRNRFAALDRSCTHGGAQCAYNNRSHTVQCTSLNHAEFTLEGVLLHGRTHGNLRTYPIRPAGPHLVIDTGESA